MRLSNSFTIARPVPEVYEAFLDVERIAVCMPGSRLLGQPAPGTYEGEVKVKVGPLSVAYSGRIAVLEADEEGRMLTIRAKGREQHGAGDASAHVVAVLTEHDGRDARPDRHRSRRPGEGRSVRTRCARRGHRGNRAKLRRQRRTAAGILAAANRTAARAQRACSGG